MESTARSQAGQVSNHSLTRQIALTFHFKSSSVARYGRFYRLNMRIGPGKMKLSSSALDFEFYISLLLCS